jgi:hypothetical protein
MDELQLYFNRLVQAIRSQDAAQLLPLFVFHLPNPLPPQSAQFIASLRRVSSSLQKVDLQGPAHAITDLAERAAQRLPAIKDFQGGDLDSQWCSLGAFFLQYLCTYDPLSDGTARLEEVAKFFQ